MEAGYGEDGRIGCIYLKNYLVASSFLLWYILVRLTKACKVYKAYGVFFISFWYIFMDRNLALEFVRVTEAAAIAAVKWLGKGDGKAADQAAVDEMRSRFNNVDFLGEIIIGEGQKDEAPELFVGEKLGTGKGPEIDIAVDPLECTDSVASGRPNAISVIATGAKGSLFHAPDMYMSKIACGPTAKGVIDLDLSASENIKRVADKLGKDISEMVIVMLDRPRHDDLILEIVCSGFLTCSSTSCKMITSNFCCAKFISSKEPVTKFIS